jgi:hypothetical protein
MKHASVKPSPGPEVVLIAAVARNGAIGRGNALIFNEPADQRHFRQATMGCPVVMGRRTWESLPVRLKLATWNVNSLAVRLPQVLDWLAANPVDVLVLQETKLTDDKFPHAEIAAAGWQAQWFGQKTYNGVALLSRAPAQDVVRNIPGFDDEQARVIAGTVDGVRVIGAYFPNGQAPDSDKFVYKMRWLDALRDWLRAELARSTRNWC